MSEEVEKPVPAALPEMPAIVPGGEPVAVAEAAVEPPPLPSAGEQLRSAREARGMSISEVAQSLMLAARQVEAIEGDDWAKLPGETFARGFVRNYARLLKLDGDALLRRRSEQAAEAVALAPNIELPQALAAEIPPAGHAKKRDNATILAAGAMVVVALLVYFLLPENLLSPSADKKAADEAVKPSMLAPTPAPVGETPPPAVVPASAADAATPTAAVAPAVPTVLTPAVPAVPAVAAPAPPPTAAAPAAVAGTPADSAGAAGAVRLKFNFDQDSWVEVTDKTGQKLVSSKNPGGSEREVAGVPPLTVVIGNASHVKLSANGKAMDLAPRSKEDVARLIVQ